MSPDSTEASYFRCAVSILALKCKAVCVHIVWVCSAVRAQAGGKCIRRRQSALSDLDIIEDRSRAASNARAAGGVIWCCGGLSFLVGFGTRCEHTVGD